MGCLGLKKTGSNPRFVSNHENNQPTELSLINFLYILESIRLYDIFDLIKFRTTTAVQQRHLISPTSC